MGVDPVAATKNVAACPTITVCPMGCVVIEGAVDRTFTWFAVTAVGIAPIAAVSAVTRTTRRIFGPIFAVTRILPPLDLSTGLPNPLRFAGCFGRKRGAETHEG